MPVQYRLYLTDKDKEFLSKSKESGTPHMMQLEPIDKTKGYREISIEVFDGERPTEASNTGVEASANTNQSQDKVAGQRPVPNPNAVDTTGRTSTVEPSTGDGAEQRPVPQGGEVSDAEQYAGFTTESRVSSLDAFFKVNEAAESKSQQRLMGQAYAYKQGKLEKADMDPKYADQIVGLAQQMSDDELKKFAETKHKGLPENK